MRQLFTTIGEILVDFTPVVQGDETVGFRMHAGGSPFNVAVALARLGARVEFAGVASTDFFGRFLVGYLEREGVGTLFLSRSPAPTALAFVALERGEPTFSFYGHGTAHTQLRSEDLPDEIEETTVLHVGSISLLAAPTSDTVMHLVDRLRRRALLSCDPNIRPSLIANPTAYRRILTQVFEAADIVKLSSTDLRWLMPDEPIEAAAAALLDLGPALVVVTLGADGCYAMSSSRTLRVPGRSVPVVDAVGAGDAFTAGLLFRLMGHIRPSRKVVETLSAEALDDALQFATAAAALTCRRSGADPPRQEEIEALLTS